MKQSYPSKRELTARLSQNNVRVYYIDAAQAKQTRADVAKHPHMEGEVAAHVGWYFDTCCPGCLPDGAPFGPYLSPLAALRAAYDADFLPDTVEA